MAASSKIFLAAALLCVVRPAASTPPVANPCAVPTQTPEPPKTTCATFTCPPDYTPKGGTIFCGNKDDPMCCKKTCCDIVTTVTTTPATTVTTTPPTTCASFTCPTGSDMVSDKTVCAGAECNASECCKVRPPPCSTVTTTPATTVTTTPPTTCASFTCPEGFSDNAADTICAGGECNKKTCCAYIPTTVTTTPPTTCESFTCPEGFSSNAASTICAGGECNKETCCKALPPPCSTVTTTPAPTCASFTCPEGFSENAADTVCSAGECNKETCCKYIPTTVTTTPPAPTCTSYTCPKGYSNTGVVCPETGVFTGGCDQATCCKEIPTAPPASPCGTVAPPKTNKPTTPPSPCGTVAPARKYDAKEAELILQQGAKAKKDSSMVPAWAFPLLGAVAMFTFVAFVAVRVRSKKSTRQLQMVQPVPLDEEAFLSDDALVE